MLDWNDLRFFLAIHRARTLAGAARALKVEHTTVGRRLTAMENALGAKLFVRTPDGFSPTKTGADIFPHAERAEAALLDVERVALGDDDRPEGTVRLTTSEAFAGLLGRWLAELRATHPRITVEILSGNATLDLTRRDADIAVRFAPTPHADLVCRRVVTMGWSLYAAGGYVETHGPLPPSGGLRDHDVIGFNDSLAQSPGAQWLAERGGEGNVVLRTGSIPAAANAALAGIGVAVIPCFVGDPEPTLVRLVPEIIGARDGYLVVHADLTRVARVRAVMDFLVQRFVDNAAFLHGAPAEKQPARRTRRAQRA